MVKQFSNASIDNIFNFAFKIVDFGKVMNEAFWAFLEIWIAFFLIFYNAFMYVYYFFLFLIDYSADESKGTYISYRRKKPGVSHIPKVKVTNIPNPIPSIYGKTSETITDTARSISGSVRTAVKPLPTSRTAKRQIGKTILEFFADLFGGFRNFISKPFSSIGRFFGSKMKPVKEEDLPSDRTRLRSQGKSLIDEYMKEYEKKKR